MILEEILQLIGVTDSPQNDDTPVACLRKSCDGCVGYFNRSVNNSLNATLVLLNMRLVDLQVKDNHLHRGRVADFIVLKMLMTTLR
jgi:hypothetical protein